MNDLLKKVDNGSVCKSIILVLTFYVIGVSYFLYITHIEIKYLNNLLQTNIENSDSLNGELSILIEKRSNIDDLDSDNSITKFVNSKISFNDKSYIPEDLVSISTDYIYDAKGGTQLLKKEAFDSLDNMAKAFYKEFNKKIVVVSAYRSYKYQKGIKDRGCPDNLCAKAGYSEHQSGLAIDLWETTTNDIFLSKNNLKNYFEWLNKNAHKYGFHNTYQKGLEIDGYEIEPWHWRYLGEDLATQLKDKNITISEFYNNK